MVAIIAILAAIGIPQYQDYIIRSQAAEGMAAATGAKAAVWEYVHNTGRFPSSNVSAGLPASTSITGKYVSAIALLKSGMIQISYGKPDANVVLQAGTLILSPVDNGGSIGWQCNSTLANRYLPTSCRST